MRTFGSVKKIREASLEDIAAVPGMTRVAAVAVHEHWARQPALPQDSSNDPTLTVHEARLEGPPSEDAEEDALESAFAEIQEDTDADAESDAGADPEPS